MRRDVGTAYEARPERSRGKRTLILAAAGVLMALAFVALLLEGCRAQADPQSAVESATPAQAQPAAAAAPQEAARAAAEYVVRVNDAGLLNNPAAQRALVEEWVVAERRTSWLADLQLTQGSIASAISEAGADPGRTLVRAYPLGYRAEELGPDLVRVEVWHLYAILGPDWPGLSGSATTELVVRRTADGWRFGDGDEVAGPDLPGSGAPAGADSGPLAREIAGFAPFAP